MTPTELENVLQQIVLQKASEKDLRKYRDILNNKLNEANWVICSRERFKARFPSPKK